MRITVAPLERINIARPQYIAAPEPVQPLPLPEQQTEATLNEKLSNYWRYMKAATAATPHLVKSLWGLIMKDWKTTLTGIVGAVAALLGTLGIVDIPANVQVGIVSVTMFLIGWFAGDKKKGE